MRLRTLTILAVTGAVVLVGGWYFGEHAVPGLPQADSGVLMFPDLAARLQKAKRIEVVHQGTTLVIEKTGDVWGLLDRGGYKVQVPKLRGLLTGLTELRLIEPRTDAPAEYSRIGVEDPSGKDAGSTLLRVLDDGGQPIAALIVGHHRVRTQGNPPEEVYVRRPDQAQTWLAEGAVQPDADPVFWLDRAVMNIDHGRIETVTVARGDAVLAFARRDGKLLLTTPADHPPLDEYRLGEVSRALELLAFQDVQTDAQPVGASIGRSVFATSDSLTVSAVLFAAAEPKPGGATASAGGDPGAKDVWVRFEAAGEDNAKTEAEQLSARLQGWTFQLGSWKERSLAPTLDDLTAPPQPGPGARQAPKE